MNTEKIIYEKLHKWTVMLILAGMALTFACCGDDVKDDAYYTFKGNTVASYCTENNYTIFAKLLEDTKKASLLSSYGHFTCFLPTDAAFEQFFKEQGKTYEQLTDEEKLTIVNNHIINSKTTDYTSDKFEEGSLVETNMNERFMVISYKTDDQGSGLTIYVNKDAPIQEKDIEVANGVIHVVSHVVNPSEEFLLDIMKQNGSFSIFAEAMELTHMNDSTEMIYDESYVCPYPTGVDDRGYIIPTKKKCGYTVFAESDDIMRLNGINSVENLVEYAKRYYGTEDLNDYTSRKNPLNKFIAYHILDRQMSTNSFLYNGACTSANSMKDRVEYYETMLEYRLMAISAGNHINLQKDKVTCVDVNETSSNISGINGFVHSVNNMLVYDAAVMENDVLNKRLRFDFYNIPPELTNNNIRWMLVDNTPHTITPDFCGKHLKFNNASVITMWAADTWTNFEADELKLNGWYDFVLRMLPVPPGSYEVRMGYTCEDWRGVTQLFIDNEIQGIPKDLRIVGTDPQVGWVADEATTDNGAENDKAMRNRGYMKAPASIWTMRGMNLRDNNRSLRIIIGQFTSQEYGAHYLRGKNVQSENREFHGDYIEIIPTSLIDREDIY